MAFGTQMRAVAAALVLGMIGALMSWAAYHVWRGARHASTSEGVPGVVGKLDPGHADRPCSGSFTSDDGTIEDRFVVVEPNECHGKEDVRGRLVEGIDMGPIDGPNSKDTVYVRDGVRGYWPAYLIAGLLSFAALVTAGPALLVFLMMPLALATRRHRES